MSNEAVTINYAVAQGGWTASVRLAGQSTTVDAADLVAVRGRAEQIVTELAPQSTPIIVHLLDGDPVAFTTEYLAARHELASTPPETQDDGETRSVPNDDADPEASTSAAHATATAGPTPEADVRAPTARSDGNSAPDDNDACHHPPMPTTQGLS